MTMYRGPNEQNEWRQITTYTWKWKRKKMDCSYLSFSSVSTFDATMVCTLFLKFFLEGNSLSNKGIINQRPFIATALLVNFVSFSVYHVTGNCTIHVREYQSTVNKVTCGGVIWLLEIIVYRLVDIRMECFPGCSRPLLTQFIGRIAAHETGLLECRQKYR